MRPITTKETVVKECDVHHETERAYNVSFPRDDKTRYWFPKSQVHIYESGLVQWISIPRWLAEEKDIPE